MTPPPFDQLVDTIRFWIGAERGQLPIGSLAIVAAVVLGLAALASLIPVLRAGRLDPAAALRYE